MDKYLVVCNKLYRLYNIEADSMGLKLDMRYVRDLNPMEILVDAANINGKIVNSWQF